MENISTGTTSVSQDICSAPDVQSEQITGTYKTVSKNNDFQLCPYLLPCGICTRTNQNCLKYGDTWGISWWNNQPTC